MIGDQLVNKCSTQLHIRGHFNQRKLHGLGFGKRFAGNGCLLAVIRNPLQDALGANDGANVFGTAVAAKYGRVVTGAPEWNGPAQFVLELIAGNADTIGIARIRARHMTPRMRICIPARYATARNTP